VEIGFRKKIRQEIKEGDKMAVSTKREKKGRRK